MFIYLELREKTTDSHYKGKSSMLFPKLFPKLLGNELI